MSLSFDLLRSFIFLGDLYPSLDNLHARLGASPLQARLYTNAQEVYVLFILIFCSTSSFRAISIRVWIISMQEGSEHRLQTLLYTDAQEVMSFHLIFSVFHRFGRSVSEFGRSCKARSTSIANSPLHRRSGSICPFHPIFCSLLSFRVVSALV